MSEELLPPPENRQVESLLDRPYPEGYREEWIERIKNPPEEETRETVALLVFRLQDEWLALACPVVKEVCAEATVHRIPRRSNDVLRGVCNVRGELQLTVALQALLGLRDPKAEAASLSRRVYRRMILIGRDNNAFAFRVEEVYGVVHFELTQMQAVPVTVAKALATYTKGLFSLRGQQIGWLDDELIFHSLSNKIL
ncbi:chemotaxis protein CheW [Ruficoccus amylovorans]|uniref:Chemotaxis protein CheW n=1 Tax=Ruficoccus amylovorans TaxID=1804625 RepID=A0A842HFW6_9BACT|nr:chemotaxis protein CheW [Ruficoccus amylovorans]MBC2594526.1 chemotaxis protein CheW [Ruficoccus amylovorans]